MRAEAFSFQLRRFRSRGGCPTGGSCHPAVSPYAWRAQNCILAGELPPACATSISIACSKPGQPADRGGSSHQDSIEAVHFACTFCTPQTMHAACDIIQQHELTDTTTD